MPTQRPIIGLPSSPPPAVTTMSTGTVKIRQRPDGRWEWELLTRSGIEIAHGARSYDRRNDAKRAANAALNAARMPRFTEPPRSRVAR